MAVLYCAAEGDNVFLARLACLVDGNLASSEERGGRLPSSYDASKCEGVLALLRCGPFQVPQHIASFHSLARVYREGQCVHGVPSNVLRNPPQNRQSLCRDKPQSTTITLVVVSFPT